MTTIKTQDLTGAALNWAVAYSLGEDIRISGAPDGEGGVQYRFAVKIPGGYKGFSPSTDWSQCGPLIEEYSVDIESAPWSAYCGPQSSVSRGSTKMGDTPLIAACRAIVSAKLGDEVDVPEELV